MTNLLGDGRIAVHVTVERLFALTRPSRENGIGEKLDALVSLTERLDAILVRYARGWERPSADEAGLRADPPWSLRNQTPMDWASSLRNDVERELSLHASVGIAASRFAARICSRTARPRGILLWLEGYEDALMRGLPLEELDELRPGQLSRLREEGVRTLDEMSRLAPERAQLLLGLEGARLVGLLRGDASSSDTGRDRLFRTATLLARRLARRLEREGRLARGLELGLLYGDGVARERYTLLPRSTAAEPELRPAVRRLLGMFPGRGEPVVGMSLSATGLTSVRGQLTLFERSRPHEVMVRIGRPRDPVAS